MVDVFRLSRAIVMTAARITKPVLNMDQYDETPSKMSPFWRMAIPITVVDDYF